MLYIPKHASETKKRVVPTDIYNYGFAINQFMRLGFIASRPDEKGNATCAIILEFTKDDIERMLDGHTHNVWMSHLVMPALPTVGWDVPLSDLNRVCTEYLESLPVGDERRDLLKVDVDDQ